MELVRLVGGGVCPGVGLVLALHRRGEFIANLERVRGCLLGDGLRRPRALALIEQGFVLVGRDAEVLLEPFDLGPLILQILAELIGFHLQHDGVPVALTLHGLEFLVMRLFHRGCPCVHVLELLLPVPEHLL